jgi:hypothetical protein
MTSVDMSPAAISRRLIRGSQLRALGVGLAGPRRRPWTALGTFELVGPDGVTPVGPNKTLREVSLPYRIAESKSDVPLKPSAD